MFSALLKKEILNNLLNLRFTVSYFLCTILLVGGAAIMVADYSAQKKVYDADRTTYEQALDGMREFWYPSDFVSQEKIVARPPQVTRIFAQGVEKDPDVRASMLFGVPPSFYGDFKRNPLTNLFPSMDTMFIIGVVLSLLIFVLTYDCIAGEREEGTLKVLLSCPVPRDLIMAAKWLGGYVSLLAPYVVAWLVIALIIVFSPGIGFGTDQWIRTLLIFLTGAVYIAVVFSLSIAVSVVSRQSGTAILSLLAIWVVLIVAIPALATPIAYLLKNPPSAGQTHLDMLMAGLPLNKANVAKLDSEQVKLLAGRKMEQLPWQEQQDINQAIGDRSNDMDFGVLDSMNTVQQNMSRNEAAVDKLGRSIARLSPYGCFQNACINFAGTGIQRELDMRGSAESYSRDLVSTYYDFLKEHDFKEYRGALAPRFTIHRTSLAAAANQSLLDITILALMGIIAFMVAFLRFMRTEIV